MQEGCLSIPEFYAEVPRALRVHLKALDRDGTPYELDADGLLAHCIQHECDHLDGKLYVEGLAPEIKREALREIRQSDWFAPR